MIKLPRCVKCQASIGNKGCVEIYIRKRTTCGVCATNLVADKYWVALSRGSSVAYFLTIVIYAFLIPKGEKIFGDFFALLNVVSFAVFIVSFYLVRVHLDEGLPVTSIGQTAPSNNSAVHNNGSRTSQHGMSANKPVYVIGRNIGWICFLFLATACWHSHAWASGLASVAGATAALMPAGRWPAYTLKRKIALLLASLVLAALLHPPAQHPEKVGSGSLLVLQA